MAQFDLIVKNGTLATASDTFAADIGVRDGRIRQGDIIFMEAVGGGFTWGSALLRY